MVEQLRDLPDGVVGISASDEVTHEDYKNVIVPAVESVLKRQSKIRFLYHLGPAFKGFKAGALWDDAKLGLGHTRAWERIAVVTDVDWVRKAMQAFGVLIPGEVRVFGNSRLSDAREWIVS